MCSSISVQELFRLNRPAAVAVTGGFAMAVSLCIQGVVSGWMDVCSIYVCPLGAALAGIGFFWVCKKEYCLSHVNLGREQPIGGWFYPMAKYVFCGVTLLVLAVGAAWGGIG